MSTDQPWYRSWFDTPYYHMLYQHRDHREARIFIDTLFGFLQPPKDARILDLACGRGRHAIQMNEKGFDVTGYDLSEQNIEFARQFENPRLHFEVRDMRQNMGTHEFDLVFNLFTSFGYFKDDSEDLKAMRSIADALQPEGLLVMDFMNVRKVTLGLVREETRSVDGIDFRINRKDTGEYIEKCICLKDKGEEMEFFERVKKLELSDFRSYFNATKLQLLHTFGDFDLRPFDQDESERLIMIAQKK
ncbi:MAG: methyltransferase domain-containing protein [Bacteroidota bacterium]|nr:methyltransferase domain-containing protein [Bacteroidota bacterium]